MNKTIQINQMLMEREDRLCDVLALERQINTILGQPYPFTIPVDLPSRQRRKKPKRKAAPRAVAIVRLRKLDETEAAYRIVYLDQNIEKTEIHTDPKPLVLLLNTPPPNVAVLNIETIRATEAGEWETVENLFTKAPPPSE